MISSADAIAAYDTNLASLGAVLPYVHHDEAQVLVLHIVPITKGLILWKLLVACRRSGSPTSLVVVWAYAFAEHFADAILVAAYEREIWHQGFLNGA